MFPSHGLLNLGETLYSCIYSGAGHELLLLVLDHAAKAGNLLCVRGQGCLARLQHAHKLPQCTCRHPSSTSAALWGFS